MKDDKVYIDQILATVEKIQKFTLGLDRALFGDDEKAQSAVIMQLMLIGELSKKISAGVKSQFDLPWKDIAGFRDVAIHNFLKLI